jgi:hypothetical protein
MTYRQCLETGKRGYDSRHAARIGTRTIGNRIRLYRCAYCGRWHATKLVGGQHR